MANKSKNKQKYKVLYSKKEHDADEKNFNDSISNNVLDYNSFKRLLTHDILCNSKVLETGYIGNVKLADIDLALKNPKQCWHLLLNASEQLMKISPHYYRINSLFSNMALFCWGIDIYDLKQKANIDTLKKSYYELAARLESMNLKHEFSKIMKVIPYQDIYCGLIVESQNDFYFQQVHYKNCRLYELQDGILNFIIDLSSIPATNLGAYPDYVQRAYTDYKDGKCGNWYKPPAEKQICLKFNSQWNYPYPIMISLVRDILDLDVYKKLKLQSARTDNYKAILIQVPIDETKVDKPLLTAETLSVFAEMNRESMNDDIGMIHTLGSKGEAISFKDSSTSRNNVADAINSIYDSSGVSKEAFNGSSSGTAVTISMENDAGFVYSFYRQLERWVNRYIKLNKYNKPTFKFSFYLLDITVFNRDTVSKRYKEACSLGMTVVDKWVASLDMTPSRLLGSFTLHKDIFDFKNNFVPLTSSFNSSSDSAGRPTNASKGESLSDSGEKSADEEKHDT